MKCFYCENEAVAICNYCGKAVCKECGNFEETAICKNSDFCQQRKAYKEAVELYNNNFTFKFPSASKGLGFLLILTGIFLLVFGIVLFFKGKTVLSMLNIIVAIAIITSGLYSYKIHKDKQ